jgi:dienelactone hydrolase
LLRVSHVLSPGELVSPLRFSPRRSYAWTAALLLAAGALSYAAAQSTPASGPKARPPARQFGAMPADALPGDHHLAAYFAARTHDIASKSMADIKTLEDWQSRREGYRQQLAEMLGLWPMPPKTDLMPVVTGKVDHAEFTVEKLHYQSMPGLYVTANLYLPKKAEGKLPAVLYVCGHGDVRDPRTGKPLGNKTSYQHHGEWFARNGYVALTIDTIQLGEISGAHHGTFRLDEWWWVNRGYTPAGVEAWNSIRAIDYLQSRPEVDGERIGVTGRSGGGAYSWWTAALDERIKVAVPVAGITDMQNHVVDGVIEGHCDCMFMTNTYRWDFAQVAALVAPRPLLIANTDKDAIFPLEGVQRVHSKVRDIYRLYGAEANLGLLITEGPHLDTQDLQVPAFRWFNRFLKQDKTPVRVVAEKLFDPVELRVFSELPADERTSKIQQSFVPTAPKPTVPADANAWARQRDDWLANLRKQSFSAWPGDAAAKPAVRPVIRTFAANGLELTELRFESQPNVPVTIHVVRGPKADKPSPDLLVLNVVEQADWEKALATWQADFPEALKDLALPAADPAERESSLKMLKNTNWAMAYVAVRGIGPSRWTGTPKRLTQIRRRFLLLGETLDGQRAWDVTQAVAAIRQDERLAKAALWLQGERRMAGIALFASLYTPDIARLDLWHLPATLDRNTDGPEFLNVLKVIDTPQAVALAAERSKVILYASEPAENIWQYPIDVAKAMQWGEKRIGVRTVPPQPDKK